MSWDAAQINISCRRFSARVRGSSVRACRFQLLALPNPCSVLCNTRVCEQQQLHQLSIRRVSSLAGAERLRAQCR